MRYHADEVIQYVKEEDVKFIRLAFSDVIGNQKNISIMPYEIEKAFNEGISFDASSILGFEEELHSDLFLHPDPSTLTVLPWRPEHGKVVRMYCSITYPDGREFEKDVRSLLIKAIGEAKKEGLNFQFGTEKEFYLFKQNEDSTSSKIPYDNAGYMDIAPYDKGENVRREICLTLEQMGIRPESSHHEAGPGQNEIDFHYAPALKSADDVFTFENVVRTVAAKYGLVADFSPKPLENEPGNGLHINMSVKSDEGKDEKALLKNIIAGVLNRIEEMTAIFNPTEESYKRLGKNKAPKYISWCKENRSHLIRIPAASGENMRAQLRSPDSCSNIYTVYTALIYAGLEGIRKNMKLPESVDENLYTASEEDLKKLKALPSSAQDAWKICRNSNFIKNIFCSQLLDFWSENFSRIKK